MYKFIVIVPVYNAVAWIGKCLESILSQDYDNFIVQVVDDCSTDGSWDIIKKYNVRSCRNLEHNGSGLENIIKGIKLTNPKDKDVIVLVDGDDYLADNSVLSYLSVIYQEDVWLTYGSFIPLSGKYSGTCQPFEKARIVRPEGYYDYITLKTQDYRQSGYWVTSHLRTFKKWLWDKIKDEDLRDENGYYKVAWDLAFMYPMIEMAGKHIKFIDKVLYMYNDLNPMSIGHISSNEQIAEGELIQKKPIYKEL